MNAITNIAPDAVTRLTLPGNSAPLARLSAGGRLEAQLLNADTAQFLPPGADTPITVTSRRGPMLALARKLIALGYPPEQPIRFTWASTGTPSLYSASLAALAGLMVAENDRAGPRFVRYQANPRAAGAVSTPASQSDDGFKILKSLTI